MKALILAGGRGERLRPLTDTTPKPLLPLSETMTTLELLLHKCASDGFFEVTLALGYRADDIMETLGDGEPYGVALRYSVEERPLGTAGPLECLAGITEPFLVLNGDTLFTFSLRALMAEHVSRSETWMTLATQTYTHTVPYGVVRSPNGVVEGIVEKPTQTWEIALGAYACSPVVCAHVGPQEPLDMPELVARICLESPWKAWKRVRTWNVGPDQDWHDIGTHASYKAASAAFLSNPVRYGGLPCHQYFLSSQGTSFNP